MTARRRPGPDVRGGGSAARGKGAAVASNAKLTEEIVRAIRLEHSRGMSFAEMARMIGCDAKSVRRIARRETWRWVE